MREAKKRDICVSFDLNFRSSMIAVADAKRLFSHFAQYADIIFGMEPLLLDSDDFAMFDRKRQMLRRLENVWQDFISAISYKLFIIRSVQMMPKAVIISRLMPMMGSFTNPVK